jgi:hypothetical protein
MAAKPGAWTPSSLVRRRDICGMTVTDRLGVTRTHYHGHPLHASTFRRPF